MSNDMLAQSAEPPEVPAGEATRDDYDGIRVDDHPVPRWWSWLFIATILFAFPYWAFYHLGAEGRTLADSYSAAAAENARLQFAEIGELQGDEATLVAYMSNPTWVRVGQSVFKANCVSCHGAGGGGLVGPNLADEAFKNIRSIEDIYTIVNKGAAAGAMPAWENRLEQNERVLVAAYVASLRGTDPGAGAKGPEGRAIAPWPEPVPEEETAETTDQADEAATAQPRTSSASGQPDAE